jgi:hypothetical protein
MYFNLETRNLDMLQFHHFREVTSPRYYGRMPHHRSKAGEQTHVQWVTTLVLGRAYVDYCSNEQP